MKHEPRLAIHVEKQLGWAQKVGWTESLGISRVGQTVLARLLESQVKRQPTSSVGGELSKGFKTSTRPDARHFSVSLYTAGALQAASSVLEPIGSKSG